MPIDPPDARKKRLCIIGGSPTYSGGLEAFCERARDAFHRDAAHVETALFHTEAAYVHKQGVARMTRSAAILIARRHDFDFAWVQVSCLSELAFVLLARALGWKVLVTPHFGGQSWLETNRLIRWLRLAIMSRAHAIGLLFTEQPQEITLPPKLLRQVIGTFLPAQCFEPAPLFAEDASVPLRLIHAARFSEAKGSLLMLDLCSRLKDAGVPFSARLVGRGDPAIMQEIDRRIARDQLEQSVSVIDWLNSDDMAEALRAADVLVHLSAIDSFPLIVLEALAADTLPIVRPMAGSRSMVRALGGHCVENDELAKGRGSGAVDAAFNWLAAQDLLELRRQGRESGNKTREAYSWSRIVGAALQALASVKSAR